MRTDFDIIVIGGGHAGVEAVHAAAKMGSSVLLMTPNSDQIGMMPCNPSIGGVGKGHLVCEVSALGGLMPMLCSKTYLQARMLNTNRGPAVQGLRLQIDKYEYMKLARHELEKLGNVTILESVASKLLVEEGLSGRQVVKGVVSGGGSSFFAKAVVITAGTFLNGTIHIGKQVLFHEGSEGPSSTGLSRSIEDATGAKLGRLKTGTPPRILRESVDFNKLMPQEPVHLDYLFEFDECEVKNSHQCFIAHTNEATHNIIQKNIEKSALFGGHITGIGPRYCPSIEDKVYRFPDKSSHHVFVEPEGVESDEIYPSGLSTSLPLDVQKAYIRSIKGFENAVISKAGYAVEYDFLQPNHLEHSLECKAVSGLFFAGQVNGTTGYEEAAAQGLMAGINACHMSKGLESFVLSRTEAYIGVMIDDLVTLGIDEPYRMFTSRAERRLLLRQDNVFARLMPHGKRLGLVDDDLYERFLSEQAVVEEGEKFLRKKWGKTELFTVLASTSFTHEVKSRANKLLRGVLKGSSRPTSRAILTLHAKVRYEGYLQLEEREAKKLRDFSKISIPETIEYAEMPGLSTELKQKLSTVMPKTVAQAQLIPGMTPAALSILIFRVREMQAA